MNVDDMENLLARMGIETVGVRGAEIQGYCPGHIQRTGHADNNPSWYINSETGAHICFSCQFKGSLQFLVCFTQGFVNSDGYDFAQATDWLKDGGELSEAFNRATAPKKEIFQELIHITESMLAAFVEPPDHALKSRGLTRAAAQKHNLLWDALRELWIITIRDPHTGKLLGWQEKAYSGRYFRNYPNGVQKRIALYGYDKYEGGDMIAVESPLDVVRLESVGITGGVATYGSLISTEQLEVLRTADRLIIAMDGDDAGTTSALSVLQMTKVFGFECWFFDYSNTDMKDVGGMSKSEILEGLENARHSVRYNSWAV